MSHDQSPLDFVSDWPFVKQRVATFLTLLFVLNNLIRAQAGVANSAQKHLFQASISAGGVVARLYVHC